MKRVILIGIAIAFLIVNVAAEEGKIKFSGLGQVWFSAGQQAGADADSYGFTVRRIRFIPTGSLSKNIKWGFHFAYDKQVAKILDAFVLFELSDNFNVKVGQFAPPAAKSAALTSSAELDFVERASITTRWGDHSKLFGYRALGVQIDGQLMDDKLYWAFMVANPRTLKIFNPTINLPDYEEQNGLSFWGRMEVRPVDGLNFGAFFGTGTEKDINNKKSSYGAHLFYVKNRLNLKLEYIAGIYGLEDRETKYNGIYSVVGFRVSKPLELAVRYGFYTPNNGNPNPLGVKKFNNITFGANIFCKHNIKFQANYVIRQETMADGMEEMPNNLFYVMCQYSF